MRFHLILSRKIEVLGLFFKKITVGFLIANLAISTTGMTLHVLHCLCKGERTVSLFTETEPQCLEISQEKPGGCCKAGVCRADDQPEKDEHSNCTHSEKKFVKLDAEFLGGMSGWTPEIPVFQIALPLPLWEAEFTHAESAIVDSNKPPPPRLSGRALLVSFQTFLC